LSHGDGQGSKFLAAHRPSKWHILSYATKTFDQLAGFKLFRISKSHDNTMIKIWEGLSDLKKKKKKLKMFKVYVIHTQNGICQMSDYRCTGNL